MLPTKGYFQDIECPFYNSSCGRPYCHFRHKKKTVDNVEDLIIETGKEEALIVPTYKPTPKSELANIHNNKSHIPICYVPDLAFRPERKVRPIVKIDKPTYKPTPLSILSSATKTANSDEHESGDDLKAIKEIKQNIANMEYDPSTSLQSTTDIDFEELDSEFAIIDEIIRSTDFKKKRAVNSDFTQKDSLRSIKVEPNSEKIQTTQIDEKTDCLDEVVKTDLIEDIKTNDKIELVIKKDESESDQEKHKLENVRKKESVTKSEKSSDKNSEYNLQKKKESKAEGAVLSKKGSSEDKTVKSKTTDVKTKKKEDIEKSKLVNTDGKEKKEKDASKVKNSSSRDSHRKEDLNRKAEHKKSSKERHSHRKESRSRTRSQSREKIKSGSSTEDKVKSNESNKEKNTKKDKSLKDKDRVANSDRRDKSDKYRNESKKEKVKSHGHDEKRKSKEKSGDRKKSKDHVDRHKSENKIKETSGTSKDKNERKKHDLKTEKSRNKHRNNSSVRNKSDETLSLASNDSDNDIEMTEPAENDMMYVDLEDNEDQTMLECYKIFNEYKPTKQLEAESDNEKFSSNHYMSSETTTFHEHSGKKRIAHGTVERTYSQIHPIEKPKEIIAPGQTLTNRYKLAKMAQANREQELLANEIQSVPVKRPAPSLLEAARARKLKRQNIVTSNVKTNIVDEILKVSNNSITSTPNIIPKPIKIAPAQNVSLMTKAKERISRIAQSTPHKTIAHTQKGPRVAHIPDMSLSEIPDVLFAEKSKLPVNVRTRFLTMLADECVKLYISKQEAYSRALNEEFACYEKCNVLATYRNSAMLAVNRLRKEIQERNSNGLGLIGIGEDDGRSEQHEFKSRSFYNKIHNWILTEEELEIHGYPQESGEHGRAIIKNPRNHPLPNLDENQRQCCRCHKIYLVDDDGWPLYDEECIYHPMKKRTIRGEQTYLCCRSSDETGCATSDTHVSEGFSSADLEGYQTTLDPESEDDPRSYDVFALDCEMCYTTKGLELTRVTIVDADCKTVYESLVKPLNPIIDYNTKFSGITKEQMDRTSTSILQVQANILHLCNSRTILIGHSLESDMKALKIVHRTVIDTSVLFPHKMGLPHKRALKALASEYLRKIIQNNVSGHDSAEDAITCMELVKWKLKEETKSRPSR